MGKYDPLRRYLENQTGDSVNTDFKRIEEILGFVLPQSAHRHPAWWANETHGSHSHSRSWQDAGWETCLVNTARGTVSFHRRKRADSASETPSPKTPLWQTAADLTGIADREMLMEAALTALIQREAGKRLAALGGTMPEAWAPERERPFG